MAESLEQIQQLIARGQWADALRGLEAMYGPQPAVSLLTNLARNTLALQQHRPDVYKQLLAEPPNDRYQIGPTNDQRATIIHVDDAGNQTSLTPGNDPQAAVQSMIQTFGETYTNGSPLGLCGLGDGYLFSVLANHPPKMFMDQQQVVHLLEPDIALLRTALTIHDWSQPNGPIIDQRFAWHVGRDWDHQFLAHIQTELDFPPPQQVVCQGIDPGPISTRTRQISQQYEALSQSLGDKAAALYASKSASDFADALAPNSARPPRVMLITCRFTTVLQYATRDIATAFENAGWETKTAIERSGYHRLTFPYLRSMLLDFEPDVVFMIDHDRRSQGGVLPPQLPIVNWIQDHMPHLTVAEAGRAMGDRDFAMSFAAPLFTDTYAYPKRQMLDMPMMVTAPPKRPDTWKNDGDDIIYVSNVSQQPRQIADEVIAAQAPQLRSFVERTCNELIDRYESGDALPTRWHLFRLVDEIENSLNTKLPDAAREQFVHIIWNPLNSALYRQQALRWIVEAADALDLSLAIYGNGWDQHPDFARFARGVIKHGPDLQEATRRAKINLHLEPYPCCAHHRMLDGLAAGGFFLVRQHPNHVLLSQLSNFLNAHLPDNVDSADEAIEAVEAQHRDALRSLIDRAACISYADPPDPVKQVRSWQRAELLIDQPDLLPKLDEVSFSDAASCRALIEHFIADRPARDAIAEAQRENVIPRLTFDNTVRRVRALLHDRLASEQPIPAAG